LNDVPVTTAKVRDRSRPPSIFHKYIGRRGRRSARPAQRGADRGEFGVQDVGEVGDDQHQNPYDKAQENDVLRHCRAFVVLAHSVEELQKL
jgi:hypothetical protein